MDLDKVDFDNRALGMLLGLHCGDSLGATLEHTQRNPSLSHREIIGGGALPWRAGQATDDTDLTLAVLCGIRSTTHFDDKVTALEFIKWYHGEPFDVGDTILRAIKNIERGIDPSGVITSESNGSLMRSAPLSLLSVADKDLIHFIKMQNQLTHGGEVAVAADIVLVKSLKSILHGMDRKSAARTLAVNLHLSKFDMQDIQKSAYGKWEDLPNSGWIKDTFKILMWTLFNCESFQDALVHAVNLGGDADTNGAIVGTVWGAIEGLDSIPNRWLTKLERQDDIKSELKRIGIGK